MWCNFGGIMLEYSLIDNELYINCKHKSVSYKDLEKLDNFVLRSESCIDIVHLSGDKKALDRLEDRLCWLGQPYDIEYI